MNRLCGTLLSMFPALERALEVTDTGPLRLLTGYQTPAAIRRAGISRLTTWLANRKARNARSLAEAAVEAAERQHTAVPGEKTIAKLVHTLAEEVMALNQQISEMDKLIEGRFRELVSVRCDPNSRKFYDRKRAEGKKHVQAVLALARRRVNVLWALIGDRRCY